MIAQIQPEQAGTPTEGPLGRQVSDLCTFALSCRVRGSVISGVMDRYDGTHQGSASRRPNEHALRLQGLGVTGMVGHTNLQQPGVPASMQAGCKGWLQPGFLLLLHIRVPSQGKVCKGRCG